MSVRALADRWDCNVSVIYKLIAAGRLSALSLGRQGKRIPIAEVERYESANTSGAKQMQRRAS